MSNQKLSIIIVKYKCDAYLKKCLNSIKKSNKWEIIIVDNDKENLGFAAGCNKGAEKAKGKYLLFLNPDTLVLDNCLEKMVNFMEKNQDVGVIGPKIFLNEKKERQLSFCRFPNVLSFLFVYSPLKNLWKNNPFWKRHIYSDQLGTSKPVEVGAVAGAAIMVRKNVFDKIGGFDENFFLYFDENDLCKRIFNEGNKVMYLPTAEIIHYGGKSTLDIRKADQYFKESRRYFLKKHYNFLQYIAATIFIDLLEDLSLLKAKFRPSI